MHNDDHWEFTAVFDFSSELDSYMEDLFESHAHIESLFTGRGLIEDEFVVKGVAGFYKKVSLNYAKKKLGTVKVQPLAPADVENYKKYITGKFKWIRELRTYRMPEVISFTPLQITKAPAK